MDYAIDYLYDFRNPEGFHVDRYLISFINDNNELKCVEIDFIEEQQCTINIVEGESDRLTKEDRMLLYYILDRWLIEKML